MSVVHQINLDLQKAGIASVIYMPQGDKSSRIIRASLYNNSIPYMIPSAGSVMVRYKKADGTGGLYNVSDSGASVVFSGNVVTAPVAAQVLTSPGDVSCEIDIYQGENESGGKLATFAFKIIVKGSVYPDSSVEESQSYSNLTRDISKAAASASSAAASASSAAASAQKISDSLTKINQFSSENLLRNWYWNPNVFINQRNIASSAKWNNQYGIDGWISNIPSIGFSMTDGYLYFGNTDEENRHITQRLDKALANDLAGKTVTLTCLSLGTPYGLFSGSVQFPTKGNSASVTTDWGRLTVGFGDTFGTFSVVLSPGAILRPVAVKLELGSNQTLANQNGTSWVINQIPDRFEELRKCQRYFLSISGVSLYKRADAFYKITSGDSAGEYFQFFIPVPTTMISSPTLKSGTIELRNFATSAVISNVTFTYAALPGAIRVIAKAATMGCTDAYLLMSPGTQFSSEL